MNISENCQITYFAFNIKKDAILMEIFGKKMNIIIL